MQQISHIPGISFGKEFFNIPPLHIFEKKKLCCVFCNLIYFYNLFLNATYERVWVSPACCFQISDEVCVQHRVVLQHLLPLRGRLLRGWSAPCHLHTTPTVHLSDRTLSYYRYTICNMHIHICIGGILSSTHHPYSTSFRQNP